MRRICQELNKLETMPPWGRTQGNDWDRKSNFVYRVTMLDALRRQAVARAKADGIDEQAFLAYVIRRWYNHHTHQVIFSMLCEHPHIRAEENPRHHTIDFYLHDLAFDLKLSRFPRAFPGTVDEAMADPVSLINWQYQQQSREWRYHTANRFFIIFHHRTKPQLTWQLRRDFDRLKTRLYPYLETPKIIGAKFEDKDGVLRTPWTCILFYVVD
ncbi:MAG: hypothetical protein AAF629_17610 [Chloroflexota bacterium]